jgi:hypothetical protein
VPKIIETKYFVGPRDAFQIVGAESFGLSWTPECIDDPDAYERKIALKNLKAALKSGLVAAHWSTMDFWQDGDLRPQDADRASFSINLEDDCVFHHNVNQPVFCWIHSEQLRSFIRGQGLSTFTPTQLAADKCYDRLIGDFSNPDYRPPKLDDHFAQLKETWPKLSRAAYKSARGRAIEFTGRSEVSFSYRRLAY